jgi:hypothetical protein
MAMVRISLVKDQTFRVPDNSSAGASVATASVVASAVASVTASVGVAAGPQAANTKEAMSTRLKSA